MQNQENAPQLAKTLSPLMIWGLGVGYVISGEYFGWNLGLEHGGPYGMLVATLLVTVMYVAFVRATPNSHALYRVQEVPLCMRKERLVLDWG